VARLFGDQRERDQAQIALRQHPAGAQVLGAHFAAAHPVPAEAVAAEAATASHCPPAAMRFAISMHLGSPVAIYL